MFKVKYRIIPSVPNQYIFWTVQKTWFGSFLWTDVSEEYTMLNYKMALQILQSLEESS